jgi:hypothetical protein
MKTNKNHLLLYQIKDLENQVWNNIWSCVDSQLQILLWSQIKSQIYEGLGDQIGFKSTATIMDQLKYEYNII